MKKIRVTLPDYIIQTINHDIVDFGFNLNNFYNRLFSIYAEKKKEIHFLPQSKNNSIMQFNLNKENEDIYMSTLRIYNIQVEAEFFRKILYDYIDMPKFKRELTVFQKTVKELEKAMSKKRKIEIKFKGEIRIIEPYFIEQSGGESRNYIHAYCEKNGEYRNFRLSKVKVIRVLDIKQDKYNEDYLEKIKINFDPFLSFGKEIKVKLSPEGKKHYDLIITNRPKIKEYEGDIYTFYCSDENAKIYFPHFYDEAEILEPKELREWFINKIENMKKKYVEIFS